MSVKAAIWIGIFLGSTLGGWLGALLAHGHWLSWQSVVASVIGASVGIYAGFKLGQYI